MADSAPTAAPSFLDSANAALDNILAYGDTDVFPFPLEQHIIHDQRAEVLKLLSMIDQNFDQFLHEKQPPANQSLLAPVGYTGFRWATQLDPIWNAYLLALVISIGDDIEKQRIAVDRHVVFSYRFLRCSGDPAIFHKDVGWPEFQSRSLELAETHDYVVVADISDFYSRVYHHRLDNALREATDRAEVARRIMKFLQHFARNNSYGLPVGGPAARLLSELLLNRVDHLLLSKRFAFCRFADDYHLFAKSKEEAYEALIFLTEKLLDNEGLSLQKSKSRILGRTEFLASVRFQDETDAGEPRLSWRRFMAMKLKYDPYSPTRDADYAKLKDGVGQFDIVGMLGRELSKTRVHEALTRRLMKAIPYLEGDQRAKAVRSLIDNIEILFPLFPQIMLLTKELFQDLDTDLQNHVSKFLRDQIRAKTHVMRLDLNVSYALRILGQQRSPENESLLVELFDVTRSHSVRRDIIWIMARWGALYWISDLKNRYSLLEAWERRAFIVASYILRDEGSHWRDHSKKSFQPVEDLFRTWSSALSDGKQITIPL
ncbi:MAG: RNA-directed DNA polymerase [Acidobacteriia bacterium]|nr:RNA-directed DNA polymerase [Terriglobia bacterium]